MAPLLSKLPATLNHFSHRFMAQKRPTSDPHQVISRVKLWAVELVAAIVFFKWLICAFLHEMGMR
jgi:hypothetical protein